MDWRKRALCTDEDPELFFPIHTTGKAYELQVDEAKSVCARCPVQTQCLEFALAMVPDGIAGGLTPVERSYLRVAQSA
jgi:WhiB family redox-sensing transcriptional regulator